jgi:hypothetical protein
MGVGARGCRRGDSMRKIVQKPVAHLFLGRLSELNLANNKLFVRVVCRAELRRAKWEEAHKVLQGTSVHPMSLPRFGLRTMMAMPTPGSS